MLIHIGYHKTGTCWLQQCFFSRPESGFRPIGSKLLIIKEFTAGPFEFDVKKTQEKFVHDIYKAHELKLIPVLSRERLSGHPWSGGYDKKIIAERLHQTFPEAKILIIIREQKNIILSNWKQFISKGGFLSFKDFVGLSNKKHGKIPLFSFEHFKYHELIKYHQQLFGEKNVLVMPYELFCARPYEFTTKITDFTGGISNPEWRSDVNRRVNESLGGVAAGLMRFFNPFLVRSLANFYSPVGLMSTKRHERFVKIIKRLDKKIPQQWLNQRIEKKWREYVSTITKGMFKESNTITSKITGLDLEIWGYELL